MATATAKTTDPDPATQQHFELIPLARVDADSEQPRKTFDPKKLAELAESVRVHGVVVPITVRPNPSKGEGWYVLIAGERRLRASKLAGKTEIPAVIDETKYSAGELLERQLLENSDREDVPPLEEADTYQKLLKLPGYSMDLLIAKTGKSKAHLYGRLKLLELAPAARSALIEGRLAPAIAELIARIPHAKLQEQATKDVLGEGQRYHEADVEPERIEVGDEKGNVASQAQPLSYRAAVALIRTRYATKLSIATFHPDDATLLPQTGACTSCPKRSGNQPGLPGFNGAEDLCTDAKCFESKTQAQWKRVSIEAKEKRIPVLDQKKAQNLFNYAGELHSMSSAPVCSPNGELPYDLRRPGTSGTWAKLLGKEIANIPRVIVQAPNGAPVEALDQPAAIKKLRELGKIDDGRKKTSPAAREEKKEQASQKKKDEEKRAINEAALQRLLGQAADAAAEDLGKKETAFWRWLAAYLVQTIGFGDCDLVVARRGLKNQDDLVDVAEKAKGAGELRGLIAELVLCVDGSTVQLAEWSADKPSKERYATIVKLLGLDWDKARDAAKAAAKAESPDAAKDAKAPAKKGKKS